MDIRAQIQINTMCVCISLSAYVTLFCLFSPKLSIILLHPDKNVRKLTMNSATYKRPFKPVSSMASGEGRNNTAGGTGAYNLAGHADGGSAGPMSTTSNVLNPGEWGAEGRGEPDSSCDCRCGSILFSCERRRRPALGSSSQGRLSPTCCWMVSKRFLGRCCEVGDLGQATALELTSRNSSPSGSFSSAASSPPPPPPPRSAET